MPGEIVDRQDWRANVARRIHAALDELTAPHGGLDQTTQIFIEETYQVYSPKLGRMTIFETRKCGKNAREVTAYFGFFMENPEDPEVYDCSTELEFVFNLVNGRIDLDSIAMVPLHVDAPPKDLYFISHYLMESLEMEVWVARQKALEGTAQSVEALMARVHDDIAAESISELTTAE